jgi:predicted amidophosphoribosyltransferase
MQIYDDPINEGPGEHDAHLMDDDLSETVTCPRCGDDIWAYSQQCEQCGLHFQGEAWQFDAATNSASPTGRAWQVVVVMIILALLSWLLL